MDVAWFLKQRTGFLRFFYENGAQPFRDILRKIEDEDPPFDPPYSEDGEPPFQVEYQQAWHGVEMVGIASLCMLSDTLKIFFATWEQLLQVKLQQALPEVFKQQGLVSGYKAGFGQLMGDDWSSCPANWAVIEQVVMARNDAQHGKDLHDIQPTHNLKTRRKHPSPFFVSDIDWMIINTDALGDYAKANLQISVTKDRLFAAMDEVEKLADWLELRLQAVLWPNGDEAKVLAIQRARHDAG